MSVYSIRLYRKLGRGVLPISGFVRVSYIKAPERVGRWATVRQSPRRLLALRENPLHFVYLGEILQKSLKVHTGTIANEMTPQQSVIIAPA